VGHVKFAGRRQRQTGDRALVDWVPTRAAGLERLSAFTPRMGRRYANGRNYDRGAGNHSSVSGLSPWLRRRLVTEEEVLRAAVAAHGPETAEKFIQEVVWRGYFKGWLERRPEVWRSYVLGLAQDRASLIADRALSRQVAAAEAGTTGIACFDAWVEELSETGYLHNHARMWFASIWIFTLELPWRLGADFFYRHLLDGDPASNTLGWRWVAGLHTRGKAYQAEAWNIAKFTDGRFTPKPGDLADGIRPLDFLEPQGLPEVLPLRPVSAPVAGVPTALLLTEEDCNPTDFPLDGLEVVAIATLSQSHLRSDLPVAPQVERFEAGALADVVGRHGFDAEPLRAGVPSDLARWAAKSGARQIATPYIPQGPLADWLDVARPALEDAGISLREWRRRYDEQVWHYATAGFFKVKKKIPQLVADLDEERLL